jgi:5-methylcytosine-specific restriction endonuclease McrA
MADKYGIEDEGIARFIFSKLRQIWLWSPTRRRALNRAKVGVNKFLCQGCGGTFAKADVSVDHIEPIGAFTTWDAYIRRLFCSIDNLQVLCKDNCHKSKTKKERRKR